MRALPVQDTGHLLDRGTMIESLLSAKQKLNYQNFKDGTQIKQNAY